MLLSSIGQFLLHYLPLWLPTILFVLWFEIWINYRRREYIKKQGSVLLEIKIPREILKSPLAMELFFNSLHNPFTGNLLDVYWKGQTRSWWSLELVSIDGEVHFFVWMQTNYRSRVEAQLYAQFPNIEVHEVPDYTSGIHHDPEKISFGYFGQFTLTKPDAYPIKTYVDYGLDKDAKEEYKHDPLVPMLEYLGSLKKGEQAWIQIMIQAHTTEGLKYGRIISKPHYKKASVEKEIKEVVKNATLKPKDDKKESTVLSLSEGQKEVIAAIERTAAKYPFDTMIRATYFAEKEVFNPVNIGGLIGSFSQFNSQALNGFRPSFGSGFDYPWKDFRGMRKRSNERQLLEAYKRRSFFNPPFKNFHGQPFILTTEELATIFHFPSSIVAATPTLSRIPSKKSEAPSNLPI